MVYKPILEGQLGKRVNFMILGNGFYVLVKRMAAYAVSRLFIDTSWVMMGEWGMRQQLKLLGFGERYLPSVVYSFQIFPIQFGPEFGSGRTSGLVFILGQKFTPCFILLLQILLQFYGVIF